ncbi:MAG: hypothetical protein IJV86_01020 [Clostridia bacterium]|nr:hypothetical protein [Clostridia bacterium]
MGNAIMDSDRYFEIDPASRSITSLNQKGSIVQFDHNSERLTFSIPRYVEGHDMTECTNVEVHYSNIDATTKAENVGVYPITDMQTDPDNEERAICTWLISQNATQKVGLLKFSIRFTCIDENANTVYSWNTGIFSSIVVLASLCNSDEIVEEYADVLEKWKQELFSLSAEETKNIAIASASAISEIEQRGEDVKKSIPNDYSSLAEDVENKADALIMTSETSKNLEIEASKRETILRLNIYGESTQSETPSPANPVEIVSIENPTIKIADATGENVQEVIIPYTLRGVYPSINYKDEIVVSGGTVKFVKRINYKRFLADVLETSGVGKTSFDAFYGDFGISDALTNSPLVSNIGGGQLGTVAAVAGIHSNNNIMWYICFPKDMGISTPALALDYINNNEVYVAYRLKNPIETDITDTECGKALLELYTNYPSTSIVCDADLKIEYRADTTIAYNNVKSELDTLKQAIINLGGTI